MPAPPLDLSRAAVFLDFDGTISEQDVGPYLLDRFAGDAWHPLRDAYRADELGSRELLIDEWGLLPHDETLLRAAADEIPLDPGFEPLVAALRGAGAEVTVVSDGFGFQAEECCARVGVPVLTNHVDWATGTLEFPHEDRCCPCSTCGTCKQAPIKEAHRSGRMTVLVGDGTSDRKAALLADRVYAKGRLAVWCARSGVAYRRFERLADVHADLALP